MLSPSARVLLRLIEEAACKGERCPTHKQEPLFRSGPLMRELTSKGYIRVELYGKQFRQVTVLVGPNAGKQTAPPPRPGKPYKVIERKPLKPFHAA
jgi:hypothetical protein